MKGEIFKLETSWRVILTMNGEIVDYSDFLTLPMAESYKAKMERI